MDTPHASRRSVLSALAAASAAPLLSASLGAGVARAATTGDTYSSNTDLYTRLPNGEGTDYARRYKRHEMFDSGTAQKYPYSRTMVMAMHGGAIEVGTSDLCLGVAGYHPATLAATPADGPAYDYWMFEAVRPSNNAELHVTASHCDDHVARSMAASNFNVLSLHGCTAAAAGAPAGRPEAVVIGGRNAAFKQYLTEELSGAGFQTIDGASIPALDGDSPDNICNRTVLGKGGQLEMTTELRKSMFGKFTRTGCAASTNQTFWAFTAACRAAIARLEAGPDQIIL
ncbi:poly-gamma-glutamate hydrolase family protein [Streptomyces sp. NPDC050516]|uniref:poly-gamma-glutamate hydrolase family protein n=1 Tax=Streptomyces sp. NPDC050516 TaxID=3365621 RepID=UPI0037B2080B